MSALDSLVRLHRWQVDECRRQLADLDLLAHKLQQEQQRLAEEQQSEQAAAANSFEAASAYGGYALRLIERRKKIQHSLASVEQQIAAARDALATAYRETKRYELAAANRATQRRRQLDRQQQRALDEIGVDAYRRSRSRG